MNTTDVSCPKCKARPGVKCGTVRPHSERVAERRDREGSAAILGAPQHEEASRRWLALAWWEQEEVAEALGRRLTVPPGECGVRRPAWATVNAINTGLDRSPGARNWSIQ